MGNKVFPVRNNICLDSLEPAKLFSITVDLQRKFFMSKFTSDQLKQFQLYNALDEQIMFHVRSAQFKNSSKHEHYSL